MEEAYYMTYSIPETHRFMCCNTLETQILTDEAMF